MDSAADVCDDELNQEYLAELMYIVKDTVSYKEPAMQASIEQEVIDFITTTSKDVPQTNELDEEGNIVHSAETEI